MDKKSSKKVATKFICNNCDYITSRKYNYDKHLTTPKHLMIHMDNKKVANLGKKFFCECGKIYSYIQGLYKHRKICVLVINNKLENNEEENKTKENEIIKHLIQQNMSLITTTEEFKNMMTEQNKMMIEIARNTNINISNNNMNTYNNIQNKQFNLNVFLNETCKDAMNLSDFIENIKVSMEDMEKTGELGFAKGISRIIMNNLNAIDVYRRPIHCSDIKRETLYIKNNGIWEKESDNKKNTKEIIYKVSCLNERQLNKWREMSENKGYDNIEHSKNDEFMKLVMEINKLRDEEIDKVITSISKHVVIDKEKIKLTASVGYLDII